MFATVDLPEPDSPTNARVVPLRRVKLTSSTAVFSPKTLVRFSTRMTSCVFASRPWATSSADSTPAARADWMRADASEGAAFTSRRV